MRNGIADYSAAAAILLSPLARLHHSRHPQGEKNKKMKMKKNPQSLSESREIRDQNKNGYYTTRETEDLYFRVRPSTTTGGLTSDGQRNPWQPALSMQPQIAIMCSQLRKKESNFMLATAKAGVGIPREISTQSCPVFVRMLFLHIF